MLHCAPIEDLHSPKVGLLWTGLEFAFLNSWQFGGAVRDTISYNDLQSVTAMSSFKVALAIVFGKFSSVCLVFFQWMFGLSIHAQNNLSQESLVQC